MILFTAFLALASLESAPQSQPEAPKSERKICRVEGPSTGSRMSQGRRVCKTASEWEADRNRVRLDAEAVKRGVER